MSLSTPLALLWTPFLSAVSSDLGFCFLPNTQLSWLPAQVEREKELVSFSSFLKITRLALVRNNKFPASGPRAVDVPQSLLQTCYFFLAVNLVSIPLPLHPRISVEGG